MLRKLPFSGKDTPLVMPQRLLLSQLHRNDIKLRKIWTLEHVFDHPWETVDDCHAKVPEPHEPQHGGRGRARQECLCLGEAAQPAPLSTEWSQCSLPAIVKSLIGAVRTKSARTFCS